MLRIIGICGLLTLTACAPADEDGSATTSQDGGSAPALIAPGQDPAAASPAPGTDTRGQPSAATGAAAEADSLRRVLFVGTSLTAGYGVPIDSAYPSVLQQRITAAGLPFRVTNAGISGETSAGGLRRIDWSLQQPVDVLVLELGANDGLRGVDPDELRSNLDAILTRARAAHPQVALVVIGMEAPPNLGEDYTARFRSVFTEMSRKHDAALVPFLLDGVVGDPSLNIDDGIHPNGRGHQKLAATVWPELESVLQERLSTPAAGRSRPVDR